MSYCLDYTHDIIYLITENLKLKQRSAFYDMITLVSSGLSSYASISRIYFEYLDPEYTHRVMHNPEFWQFLVEP